MMLSLEHVKYVYGEREISYPNWSIERSHHALILGNSGSGKTTLLHLIGGLMKVSSGKLEVAGMELSKIKNGELDRFRGNNIGIVFQRPHLVKSLTVKENLMLARSLAGLSSDGSIAESILTKLDILELKNRKVHQISQGQAQRVAIARAIINEPKLLLADEPTASLDDENCSRVIKLLKKQAEETNTTLIVATHDHRIKGEFKNSLSL